MIWNDCNHSKPEPMTEVLVWIDGHRNPSWSNNYALVAFMNLAGEWWEQQHNSREPLRGVIAWTPITRPTIRQ